MVRPRTLPASKLREIAVAANVDPRTVQRALTLSPNSSERSARHAAVVRATEALRRAGILPGI